MDDGPNSAVILWIFIVLIIYVFSCLVTAAKTSFASFNENKMSRLADNGKVGTKTILKLVDKKGGEVFSSLELAQRICSFAFSGCIFLFFMHLAETKLIEPNFVGKPQALTEFVTMLSAIVVLFVSVCIYSVFAVSFIQKLAMQNPENTAASLSWLIKINYAFNKGFVKFNRSVAGLFVRIFGLDPHADEAKITEEEIRMMVDEGGEKGVLEDEQREMINNIFDFDDIDAGDVMTHRMDIEAVSADDDIQTVVELSMDKGFSRIPVYDEELDNIVGIIYIKDLLKFVGEKVTKNYTMKQLARPAFFVPETMQCRKVFEQMTEKHVQMAIVVDEYGGTAGLITMEDLLESIVGNIQDEYDDEDEEITKIDENTFTFDGSTAIEEFCEVTGCSENLPEGDYDTVAGLFIALLGYVPKDGENPSVEFDNMRFYVIESSDRRIEKIKVVIDNENKPSEEKSE